MVVWALDFALATAPTHPMQAAEKSRAQELANAVSKLEVALAAKSKDCEELLARVSAVSGVEIPACPTAAPE